MSATGFQRRRRELAAKLAEQEKAKEVQECTSEATKTVESQEEPKKRRGRKPKEEK